MRFYDGDCKNHSLFRVEVCVFVLRSTSLNENKRKKEKKNQQKSQNRITLWIDRQTDERKKCTKMKWHHSHMTTNRIAFGNVNSIFSNGINYSILLNWISLKMAIVCFVFIEIFAVRKCVSRAFLVHQNQRINFLLTHTSSNCHFYTENSESTINQIL